MNFRGQCRWNLIYPDKEAKADTKTTNEVDIADEEIVDVVDKADTEAVDGEVTSRFRDRRIDSGQGAECR